VPPFFNPRIFSAPQTNEVPLPPAFIIPNTVPSGGTPKPGAPVPPPPGFPAPAESGVTIPDTKTTAEKTLEDLYLVIVTLENKYNLQPNFSYSPTSSTEVNQLKFANRVEALAARINQHHDVNVGPTIAVDIGNGLGLQNYGVAVATCQIGLSQELRPETKLNNAVSHLAAALTTKTSPQGYHDPFLNTKGLTVADKVPFLEVAAGIRTLDVSAEAQPTLADDNFGPWVPVKPSTRIFDSTGETTPSVPAPIFEAPVGPLLIPQEGQSAEPEREAHPASKFYVPSGVRS